MSRVAKIVLTGGPCGGKTTALPLLRRYLENWGFVVGVVPELATLLFDGGWLARQARPGFDRFMLQGEICRLQMAFEDTMEASLLTTGKPAVLLCDRGVYDNFAYMDEEAKKLVGIYLRRDLAALRYDGVVHLVTAADGAPAHYGQRFETPEQAIERDTLTREAWLKPFAHELYTIGNAGGFDHKVDRAKTIVLKVALDVAGRP